MTERDCIANAASWLDFGVGTRRHRRWRLDWPIAISRSAPIRAVTRLANQRVENGDLTASKSGYSDENG